MSKNIYVTQTSLPEFDEYISKISRIWDNHILTNGGPIYNEFVDKLKKYLSADKMELYVNGHMALDIAIKALNLKGEVITTPFTFVSTTHALTMNGIEPVFCDIKSTDYNIDESKVEELITEKTTAILAVHVYGQPCNVKELQRIADRHNLALIFDAAHAFGVKVNGIPISNYGDVSMFSFHATKVFSTIEGGALIYKDDQLTNKLQKLKNFGIDGPETVLMQGFNAKMNEFAAAMGTCNLDRLDDNIQSRKEVAYRYIKNLQELAGIKLLDYELNKKLRVQDNFAYFPIIIKEEQTLVSRDEIFEALQKENIFSRKYFYPLVTDTECYKDLYSKYELKVAKKIAKQVLALPIFSGLELGVVDKVCEIIKKAIEERKL